MGIRGLKTFVNEHFTAWKTVILRGELIIDGYSLLHSLYNESREERQYGGDYVNFSRYVEQFLVTLKRCGINPFVVFDGIDSDGTKKITHAKRRLEGAYTARGILTESDPNARIAPYLSKLVMIETVARVLGKDRLCVADGDADSYIAYLGSIRKCPILSDDSDFFVFHLSSGYIPYYTFQWRKGQVEARVFFYKNFIKQMNIKDATLLILLPAILGNDVLPSLDDIVRKMIRREFYRIDAIVRYISCFSNLGEAKKQMSQVSPNALQSIKVAYRSYYGAVDGFRSNPEHRTALRNYYKGNSELPSYLVERFRIGEMPQLLMDALCLSDVEHSVTLEDTDGAWCHMISEPIRKVIYGTLCGKDAIVFEHRRHHGKMEFYLEKVHAIHVPGNDRVYLESISSCSLVDKKQILFSALGCKEDDFSAFVHEFSNFASDLVILLAITRFWYKAEDVMDDKQKLLSAFLLTLIKMLSNPPHPSKAAVKNSSYPLPRFVHAFAQWQSVYHDTYCLNKLLLEPVKLFNVSSFFTSAVIYQYVSAITQSGINEVMLQCNFSAHKSLFDTLFECVVHV
ncbi:protein asteroid homolog 1-like [Dysidea avara]|uniref:protein asteroid homolog 1-like n=1 Tax=Dysidea avara TaxID=196820 RepID=UPI0033262087